ncbi:MAG: hypothetical protein M1831_007484 [Alyxoria varia]|nr:MAG: hypothetical protein M1831_007484 [Alyxoria varia]
MSSSIRPTVVLVPGAFITPTACFNRLVPQLEGARFPTVLASLPSSKPSSGSNGGNSDNASSDEYRSCTVAADAQHVRDNILQPLVDGERKKVIVLAHSYGAVVSGAAAFGLSPGSLSGGGGNGVLGLVNVAGMLLPEGVSLQAAAGGELPPNIVQDSPQKGLSISTPGQETPHATAAFTSPSPKPAWVEPQFEGRLAFVRTMRDEGFPPAFQEAIIGQTGVKWEVVDFDAPHDAFETMSAEVVKLLEKLASQWENME